MFNRTTVCRRAKRLLHACLDEWDRRIFLGPDLDAVARGWQVARPRLFVRRYRDPRWDRERVAATRDGRP